MHTEFLLGLGGDLQSAISGIKVAINEQYSDPAITVKAMFVFPQMQKTLEHPDGQLVIAAVAVMESVNPFPSFKPSTNVPDNKSHLLHATD